MSISVQPTNVKGATILKLDNDTSILYCGETPIALRTENFEVVSNRNNNGFADSLVKPFLKNMAKAVVLPQEEINHLVSTI